MNTIPMAPPTASKPQAHNAESVSDWDRVKEAFRRDWEQTKHDLGLYGGHDLNQNAADTINQVANLQLSPEGNRPILPVVVGAWAEAEYPIGYGYAARRLLGDERSAWNEGVEKRLRADWEGRNTAPQHGWDKVRGLIRYGFEYSPQPSASPQ